MRKLLAVVALGCCSFVLAAQDEPAVILQKGIIAQGGERLAKTRTLLRIAKGELDAFPKPIPFVGEARFNLPEQARWSFELDQNKQKSLIVLVVNKDKGWRASGGAAQEMTARELETFREDAYVHWLMTLWPILQDKFELSAVPEAKVNGEAAVGIKVASKGKPDVRLFFDKKTSLLAKVEYKGKEADLVVNKEIIVSDYKNYDGLKLPSKLLFQSNGKRVAEWNVTEYKFPDKIDEASFGKP
jgi:hypothetical protein